MKTKQSHPRPRYRAYVQGMINAYDCRLPRGFKIEVALDRQLNQDGGIRICSLNLWHPSEGDKLLVALTAQVNHDAMDGVDWMIAEDKEVRVVRQNEYTRARAKRRR